MTDFSLDTPQFMKSGAFAAAGAGLMLPHVMNAGADAPILIYTGSLC